MRINDKEFPIVVQAYDNTSDPDDRFVAEQVVHTQAEIDNFTSRYSGLLIKARVLSSDEIDLDHRTHVRKRSASSAAWVWLLILIVIVGIAAYGWYTGWIQRTFNLNI